jgi:hypothetical protein
MQKRTDTDASVVGSIDVFVRRDQEAARQFVHHVAGVIAIFVLCTCGFATAGQQSQKSANRTDSSRGELSGSFEVPRSDLAEAEALANKLAALSPKVDRKEATLLAECAYATVGRLRRQYQMFGTPIFNNFLVYHGFRKRGYCYQWTEDVLVALDALKLKTLDLHWGESYAGTWRENNCLVVTAKGQPFERGMILEAWRHFGHLRWNLLLSDEDRYFENGKYAELVRARAANRHVAFQSRLAPSGKAGDQ